MAGSGPPPNPTSRRQAGNQSNTWTDLPADGYDGDLPGWPLVTNEQAAAHLLNHADGKVSKKIPMGTDAERLDAREAHHWSVIWRSPQAAAWARNGWTHDVALYVRYLVKGEFGDLDSAKEARMWSDRLGLNPTAMLKNRWRIKADDLAEKRESKKPAKKSPRERLKVVASDGVAGS